ncbi:MAG: adenylylsulfate kinase [Bacteroidota bacterium]
MSNIFPQHTLISSTDRERLLGQQPAVLWFTGLSGSGKSTLADHMEQELYNRGFKTYLLDGDNIRHGLNSNLDFSEEGRQENIRRIGEVSKLFLDAGIIVLTAFISPYRSDRERVRGLLPENRFVEIFVDCPIEVCETRDVKGLYAKARAGKISDFTGIHSPYEPPLEPELVVETHRLTIETCVQKILDKVLPLIRTAST